MQSTVGGVGREDRARAMVARGEERGDEERGRGERGGAGEKLAGVYR